MPVSDAGIVEDLDTGSPLPTYALVRPGIANTYADASPMGVSVFDDGCDAMMAVDEAFDGLYWALRLCQPRVFLSDEALAIDRRTGRVMPAESIDTKLLRPQRGSVGESNPITVYAPDMQMGDREAALNACLSVMSAKCGFGPNYFSYSRQTGLRTATEVTADNSQLFRNLRKHEQVIGESLTRLFEGAYAAEQALNGRAVTGARVEVTWDDSVVEDTGTERAMMKDDIARGLCPAWLYPMTYYGMDEASAKALVGAQALASEEL